MSISHERRLRPDSSRHIGLCQIFWHHARLFHQPAAEIPLWAMCRGLVSPAAPVDHVPARSDRAASGAAVSPPAMCGSRPTHPTATYLELPATEPVVVGCVMVSFVRFDVNVL